MRPFEYARPTTEAEAVEMLQAHDGNTAVLAGGTDLISLLNKDVLSPERVVDIKHVDSLQGITSTDDGVLIGALTTLEEISDSPLTSDYRGLTDAVSGIRAIQVQSSGTIGGDLCHLPNCWYYRNGYGLLGLEQGESLPLTGDNRYHAVIGNRGVAKFVSATRLAPSLISWGARVRIVGPQPTQEEWRPLEHFYQTPKTERQGCTALKPGQLLTHIWLPMSAQMQSATYDVQQLQGLDWPMASASVCLGLESGIVQHARVVLGHLAPVPWIAAEAAELLIGHSLTESSASAAAEAALAGASPLSMNGYKVQMGVTAVKRALLKATNQWQED